jgi:hypothetical protein
VALTGSGPGRLSLWQTPFDDKTATGIAAGCALGFGYPRGLSDETFKQTLKHGSVPIAHRRSRALTRTQRIAGDLKERAISATRRETA